LYHSGTKLANKLEIILTRCKDYNRLTRCKSGANIGRILKKEALKMRKMDLGNLLLLISMAVSLGIAAWIYRANTGHTWGLCEAVTFGGFVGIGVLCLRYYIEIAFPSTKNQ